ncbi:hypothetical protein A3H10_00085 [Candidatus Uhrbacteria bacterium RIFCSPLOWO2_12_FULL_46_10]|uniref:AB hydrolase-1 domain-containing protein n=1 Tax=Candidatus Uhrbacteria bacterium RIFCSPLOWO2_01_FULL_47_25 TaxID=1802402 RepID=A0A1F7UTE3_9BACT|nr:MAG: hypothetical protein A2752_05140 [Candidatus Uhrbacteria bacterium RIFCSPHIGHO2_01_FULL_46_23]OGL67857.1 MAG: hypothetical protein A3D60_01315 [Candidatus Uhrbacteria bacterium RIFCSPHIGHO2_02_FULL_47_29]OGL76538.1 MAG: hypothetical protein A3E96_00685 [Candidatus Uhrbacteria bacterium RIFCSPHIGHO2_12_FULL_46_13]OGL81526.1 MAG: hypothetical protein A2936_01655 [Candidatus Uhrbacteria bacterium RIFCSPLOWO2_01_FULL_47_25]OGL85748.1 MAG: hypothetical protein A3I37_02595 [Candidatus Uhrbact
MGERSRIDSVYAKAAGLTHESRVPGTEHRRELTTRWHRGELYRVLRDLRREAVRAKKSGGDVASTKERLNDFYKVERQISRELDELNRQLNDNVAQVEIETSEIGHHSLPVVTLDLHPPREGEKDDRVPTMFLGGIATSPYQQFELASALALSGQRVHCFTYPEHSTAEASSDWIKRLQADGTYRLHAAALKETIKQLGLERVNLVGLSMGGGIALEAASDPEFADHIEDLIVLEPVGLEEKSLVALGRDFVGKQVLGRTLLNPEGAVKSWRQGDSRGGAAGEAMQADIDILRRRQITSEKLKAIHPQGRYVVAMGTKSPMVDAKSVTQEFLEAEPTRRAAYVKDAPLEILQVQSRDHSWPLVHALGLARWLSEPRHGDARITTIDEADLEHSTASFILEAKH